ncbi:MAG: hypothetical protein R2809_10510 [Flavobacteriales bacterium]
MKKAIGVLLIALALALGYFGIEKFSNSGESVEVVGIELSAENNKEKTISYFYLGFAAVSLIGGIVLLNKK